MCIYVYFVTPSRLHIDFFPGRLCLYLADYSVELHLKRLVDLHRAELKKEQLQEQLQSAKEQIAENYRLEFSVPRDLFGLVIGKKGKNRIAAEQMEGIVKYDKTRRVRFPVLLCYVLFVVLCMCDM
jgi:hypothetical protein